MEVRPEEGRLQIVLDVEVVETVQPPPVNGSGAVAGHRCYDRDPAPAKRVGIGPAAAKTRCDWQLNAVNERPQPKRLHAVIRRRAGRAPPVIVRWKEGNLNRLHGEIAHVVNGAQYLPIAFREN